MRAARELLSAFVNVLIFYASLSWISIQGKIENACLITTIFLIKE